LEKEHRREVEWDEPRSLEAEIEETAEAMPRQQRNFRRASEYVAAVAASRLFGS